MNDFVWRYCMRSHCCPDLCADRQAAGIFCWRGYAAAGGSGEELRERIKFSMILYGWYTCHGGSRSSAFFLSIFLAAFDIARKPVCHDI